MGTLFRTFYRDFGLNWLKFLGFFLLSTLFIHSFAAFVKPSETNYDKEMKKQTVNKLITSCAQTVTLCAQAGAVQKPSERLLAGIMKDTTLGIRMKCFIELQFAYGLRVSEVLQIFHNDLLSSNRIRIKSLKGSTQRIIVFNDSFGYFNICRYAGVSPFMDISRFTVYRVYKRLGINYDLGPGYKKSVTHAPRHFAANELQQENKDSAYTTDFLRHKSNESLNYYK